MKRIGRSQVKMGARPRNQKSTRQLTELAGFLRLDQASSRVSLAPYSAEFFLRSGLVTVYGASSTNQSLCGYHGVLSVPQAAERT